MKMMNTLSSTLMILLCAVCAALGGHRYIAIPLDGIDGIDVIEVNPIASASLLRAPRQAEAYVHVSGNPAVIHQNDPEAVQRPERAAVRALDYIDYGGHTGSNGAFSWYADYPAHRNA